MPTPNLNLPLFVATESIDLISTYNAAMSALDTKIKQMNDLLNQVNSQVTEIEGDVSTATSTASQALSTANTAKTTADAANNAIKQGASDTALTVEKLNEAKVNANGYVYWKES